VTAAAVTAAASSTTAVPAAAVPAAAVTATAVTATAGRASVNRAFESAVPGVTLLAGLIHRPLEPVLAAALAPAVPLGSELFKHAC
jgi:hypothetical protein